MKGILRWAPRVLALLFVGLLSIFALDVFSIYQGWDTVLALLIHLVPSFALLIVVGIAWRYELVGAVVFIGGALLYVWGAGLDRPWSWYAGIVAPAAVIGFLYLASWFTRRKSQREIQ